LRGDHFSIDFDRLVSTIKHEILHTLVFSSGLFAFFRDSNGKPLTERDPATRWPKFYDEKLQVYTPSDQVLKQIKIVVGMMYHMNMVNLFFGDAILVVILLKQVVNNGSIQNLKKKKDLIHSVFHHQHLIIPNVSVHTHTIK